MTPKNAPPPPPPGPARSPAAGDDDDEANGGGRDASASAAGGRRRPRRPASRDRRGSTSSADGDGDGDGGSYPSPRLLSQPRDPEYLSGLVCLVRRNVEAFVATPADLNRRTARGGLRDMIVPGRSVGVRCVHCARNPPPPEERVRCATSYPRSVRLVYQSVRNWQRHHFWGCPAIPRELKEEYGRVKEAEKKIRSGAASSLYWEECCRRMGMVDTDGDNGIRLRGGKFAEGNRKAEAEDSVAAVSSFAFNRPFGREKKGGAGAVAAVSDGKRTAERQAASIERKASQQVMRRGTAPKAQSREKMLIGINKKGGTKSHPKPKIPGGSARRKGGKKGHPEFGAESSSRALAGAESALLPATVAANANRRRGSSAEVRTTSSKDEGSRCDSSAPSSESRRVSVDLVGDKVDDSAATTLRHTGAAVAAAVAEAAPNSVPLLPSRPDDKDMSPLGMGALDPMEPWRVEEMPKSNDDGSPLSPSDSTLKAAPTVVDSPACPSPASLWDSAPPAPAQVQHPNPGDLSSPAVAPALGGNAEVAPQTVDLTRNVVDDGSVEDLPLPQGAAIRGSRETDAIAVVESPPCPSPDSLWDPEPALAQQNLGGLALASSDVDTAAADFEIFSEEAAPPPPPTGELTCGVEGTATSVAAASLRVGDRLSPPPLEPTCGGGCDASSSFPAYVTPEMCVSPPVAPPASPSPSPSVFVPISNEQVLERVRLAIAAVRAAGQIRALGPLSGGAAKLQGGDCVSAAAKKDEELRSLGAELYELFAGQAPYSSSDDVCNGDDKKGDDALAAALAPDELPRRKKREKRQAETAGRGYVPLSELGLPPSLCGVVSSLLDFSGGEEDEEDGRGGGGGSGRCKYTSADEVEEDLRLLASHPERFLFRAVVGSGSTGEFCIPRDALHGRSEETSKLMEAYRRASAKGGRNEMVLISGYSGTGKSSLVRHARDRFVEHGARFISGKFDAMLQMRPLSAIVRALDDYCGILADDYVRIDKVREAVSKAIGGEGRRVLSDLIPNLGRIIDVCADDDDDDSSSLQVSGREALQRLVFLFRMLLRSTCGGQSSSPPVVLFLDDLQWADEVSIELLLALIADPCIRGLLFVGCYRDDDAEMGPDHPFTVRLDALRRSGSGVNVRAISLGNLDVDSVNSLISETLLGTLPRTTRSLAEAVHHKTSGNALFVVQLLSSLYDEGLLRFALTSRRWEWDMEAISRRDVAENVVGLMTSKFRRLDDPAVHEALRMAACFGAQCEEELLRILDRVPDRIGSISSALDVAVAEGIMDRSGTTYRFSHDQIQRAAYLLVPESDREDFHLTIGRLLWKYSSAEEMDAFLFVVVDQLHRGCGRIDDGREKIKLAQLSLQAGRRAYSVSAFLPAAAYLKAGISLLSDDDWDNHRDVCLDLHDSCAETEFILGDFVEMKGHLERVLRRGRNLKEKLRAYYTLVQSLGTRGLVGDAADTAVKVLGHLGEAFPREVGPLMLRRELMRTQEMLGGRTEDSLLQLEAMQNPQKLAVMRFLYLTMPYFYSRGKKEYFSLCCCKMVQLSVSHGVCRQSAFGFATFGMIISGIMGERVCGYRHGKLALSLLDRFHGKEILARTYWVVYGFLFNWTEPLQSCLVCHKEAIQVGLCAGDTLSAMVNAQLYLGTALACGQPLGHLIDEKRVFCEQIVDFKHHFFYKIIKPLSQAALNLLGRSPDPTKLSGEEMDEDEMMRTSENYETVAPYIYFYRLWLAYLFGRYELAAELAEKNRDVHEKSISRFPIVCNYVLYSGLAFLALARKNGPAQYIDGINNAIAQMKMWADGTPWNCQHKVELLGAEYAYLLGDLGSAAKFYDEAANTAAKHRFIHEQALALERAGIFYLETGDVFIASSYFVKAKDCYAEWGAKSKVAHVQECYL